MAIPNRQIGWSQESNLLWLILKQITKLTSVIGVLKPNYRIYRGLISQSGTDAPTVIVLENTLGDIVWSYNSTGSYSGTLVGAFTTNKTFVPSLIGYSVPNGINTIARPSFSGEDIINFGNLDTFGTLTDDSLTLVPIEIIVYN
jgi:hypothetical protein